MKWHHPDELPKGDMEVLAKYGNFPYANHVVLKYDNGYWWQHLPPMPPIIPDGGWFGIDESAILGWAYINKDEEPFECDVDDLNGDLYNYCVENGLRGDDRVNILIIKEDEK